VGLRVAAEDGDTVWLGESDTLGVDVALVDWVCEVVGAPESVAEAVTDSLGEDDWDALLPCERVPEGEEVDKPDAVEDGVTLPEGVEVPLGVSLEDTA
jgi:hypothetical protein